jgi:hypothetical protein
MSVCSRLSQHRGQHGEPYRPGVGKKKGEKEETPGRRREKRRRRRRRRRRKVYSKLTQ